MYSRGAWLVFLMLLLNISLRDHCSDVFSPLCAGTQLMAKGKAPSSVSHHVIVQGESHQTLLVYLGKNPIVLLNEQPPGQMPGMVAPEPQLLDDRSRLFLFSVIDMVDDLVNSGVCLKELLPDNIVVLPNGRPKLNGVVFIERRNCTLDEFKVLATVNFSQLKTIITRDIFSNMLLPADLQHLLYIMGHNPLERRRLINHHTAAIPIENFTALFLRLYNYVWVILRKKDPSGFLYVMENLEFDPFWRQNCGYNSHLQKYIDSKYDNTQLAGTIIHRLMECRKVLKFNRNPPSHPLDYALDFSSADGMAFSQCGGLGRIYHAQFSRLTYSMMDALERIECLKNVEIRSLFTNSIKTTVDLR